MSNPLTLDDLIRDLKETAAIGDEQLQNTTRETVNFIVSLADKALQRRKPGIKVTQKLNSKNPEQDNSATDVTGSSKPKSGSEYADLDVTRKKALLEQEAEQERDRARSPQDRLKDEAESTPLNEEELPNSTRDEEEFSPSKSSGETLYKFSNFLGTSLGTRASFKPGMTGVEAQAILDLISSSEGSKINNGENLVIKSGGKTLFETDAEGKVTYSANDRDPRFKSNRNIPVVNSINDLQQRATSIVRNEQSLREELEVTRLTGTEPADRQFERTAKSSSMARSSPEILDVQGNKDKVEALEGLKDSLDRNGELKLSDGSTVKAEAIPGQESSGTVEIKMYEVGASEPVVLGKMDKYGNVVLDKEFTAKRYATVSQFFKDTGLGKDDRKNDRIVSPTATANKPPDPLSSLSGQFPAVATAAKPPTATELSKLSQPGVSLKDLKNLKNYYANSPDEKAKQGSAEAKENFDRYKSQLFQDGKEVSNNPDSKMTDKFFSTFQSNKVDLTPADRANLEEANTFAAEQNQLKQQNGNSKSQTNTNKKQRTQTSSVGL